MTNWTPILSLLKERKDERITGEIEGLLDGEPAHIWAVLKRVAIVGPLDAKFPVRLERIQVDREAIATRWRLGGPYDAAGWNGNGGPAAVRRRGRETAQLQRRKAS